MKKEGASPPGADIVDDEIKKTLENKKVYKFEKTFIIFDSLFQIIGKEYLILKKFLFYSIVGHIARNCTIKCGMVEDDLRIPFITAIKSGLGKEAIKSILLETFDDKMWQIVSLHPEQLVGTLVQLPKKNDDAEPPHFESRPGFLKTHQILFKDDAVTFLNSTTPIYEESRNYILESLNPIGKNKISKKLVKSLEPLEFYPDCSIFLCIQPVDIIEENISTGLGRRLPILHLNVSDETKKTALENRWRSGVFKPQKIEWKSIIDTFTARAKKKLEWQFTEEAIDKIVKYGMQLNNLAKSIAGNAPIVDSTTFTSQNLLARMAVIRAFIDNKTTIEHGDVYEAMLDLQPVWKNMMQFHKTYVKSSKNKKISPTHQIDATIIGMLKEAKAFSETESRVSVQKLLTDVCRVTGSPYDTVYNHYQFLKDQEILGFKKGQHHSRVWLKGSPLVPGTSDTSNTSQISEVPAVPEVLGTKELKSGTSDPELAPESIGTPDTPGTPEPKSPSQGAGTSDTSNTSQTKEAQP